MRTALLAAAAVLTLGSTALASSPQAQPQQQSDTLLQSDACVLRAPRLLHTALSPRPAEDCCPATTSCAGYLGMTETPRRPARLKG